jgi:hypothetical protein
MHREMGERAEGRRSLEGLENGSYKKGFPSILFNRCSASSFF